MANRRISPYNVEVVLKPADRTIACPEEDRCQLEMIKNDYPDIMQVVRLSYGDTQHVHVGLLGTNGGCDYDCHVGMIPNNGLVAYGEEKIEQTVVVVVVFDTLYGIIWSTDTTTSRRLVSYDVPDGSTSTTTSSTDGYYTTQTTETVTVSSTRWERLIVDCSDASEVKLPVTPRHLTSVQYWTQYGEKIVLTQILGAGGDRHVQVARKFGPPLLLSYEQNNDSLVVSSALSNDLQSLFVVVSRMPQGGSYIATYYWYSYSTARKVWVLYRQGTVPLPWGYTTNYRPSYVDRSGDVVGFFAAEKLPVEQDQGSTALKCSIYPGYEWDNTTGLYGQVYGGAFNIVSGEYTKSTYRSAGQTLTSGDIGLSTERLLTNTWYSLFSTYTWGYDYGGNDVGQSLGYWSRGQDVNFISGSVFSLSIGGVSLAQTWDDGQKFRIVAAAEYDLVRTSNSPLPAGTCELTRHQECTQYEEEDFGSRLASISAGGWVSVRKVAYERVGTLPYIEDSTTEVGCNTYSQDCISYIDWYRGSGSLSPWQDTDTTHTIYPINLGEVRTGRTFTAVDSRGDWYAGAEVVEGSGTSGYWRVFKNGAEITAAVENCIGRPIEQMAAMYWRV